MKPRKYENWTDAEIVDRVKETGMNDPAANIAASHNAADHHLELLKSYVEKWKIKQAEKSNNAKENEVLKGVRSVEELRSDAKKLGGIDYRQLYLLGGNNYTIKVDPTSDFPKNTGLLTLRDKGANIKYAGDEELYRHIVICHELGHLLLHSECWLDRPGEKQLEIKQPEEEVQAFRCAEWMLCCLAQKCEATGDLSCPPFLMPAEDDLFKAIDAVMNSGKDKCTYEPGKTVPGADFPATRLTFI